jgi:hypothetical protein
VVVVVAPRRARVRRESRRSFFTAWGISKCAEVQSYKKCAEGEGKSEKLGSEAT